MIRIVFDKRPGDPFYSETVASAEHAIADLGADVAIEVIRTGAVTDELIAAPDGGVFIGPGTPFEHPDRAEALIRSARERGVPLVAT